MSYLSATPIISEVDPFAENYILDPYPFHSKMRDAGPIIWLEKWKVFAVARYQQVHAVLSDWRTFCSSAGVGLTDLRHGAGWRRPSLLLETDPPAHTANRAIVSRVLSPVRLRALQATFEREAEDLVDRLLGRTIEATSELAEAFPTKVFGDAVGVSAEGRDHIIAYGKIVFNGMGPRNELFEQSMDDVDRVSEWVSSACLRGRLDKGCLGAEIYDSVDSGTIDESHAALLVRSFLSAGVDTTMYAIGNALFCFASHPRQWERVRKDPSLIKSAFDEVMRFESPFQTFFRTAACDTELAGIQIAKDSRILISVGAANRDPKKWVYPEIFAVGRNTQGHPGFGTGIHGCVGQMMARLEVEALLSVLVRRVRRFEFAGEPVRQLHNTLRGFERLPLRLVN